MALGARGAELFQRSEQEWPRFITAVCPVAAPAAGDRQDVQKICLEEYTADA